MMESVRFRDWDGLTVTYISRGHAPSGLTRETVASSGTGCYSRRDLNAGTVTPFLESNSFSADRRSGRNTAIAPIINSRRVALPFCG